MDDLTRDFASETLAALDVVECDLARARSGQDQGLYISVFRLLHTIKGTCGFLNLPRLETLAHAGEDRLTLLRPVIGRADADLTPLLHAFDEIRAVLVHILETGGEPSADLQPAVAADAAAPPVHLSADNLEQLFADVSELGQISMQVLAAACDLDAPALRAPMQALSHSVRLLESHLARVTMQPIEAAWRHAPRVARQIAEAQGKIIAVELAGGDTEIDRGMFGVLRDIVVHLVRNAADHGIEPVAQRQKLGKPEQGLIRLCAREQAGRILLTISDDGCGFDPAQVAPGAAGKPASHISGRGIGLGAVRAAVEAAGGNLSINSRPGTGTRFDIALPLIVAVVPCLMLEAAGQCFALPQSAVLEVVRAPGGTDAPREIACRSGQVEVLDLAGHLALAGAPRAGRLVAICEAGERRFGLLVDAVREREALSLKPLGFASDGLKPFGAAAVSGGGTVVLVLDAGHFAAIAGRPACELQPRGPAAGRKVGLLEFTAGDDLPRMVRLSDLKRICMAGTGNDVPVQLVAANGAADAVHCKPVLVVDGPEGDVGLAVERVGEVQMLDAGGLPPPGEDEPGYAALNRADGSCVQILNPAGFLRTMVQGPEAVPAGVLLLEPDAFCRALIAASLQAAGHRVQAMQPEDRLPRMRRFAAIVLDLDSDWASAVLAERQPADDAVAHRVGLSARLDGDAARRARAAGVTTIVGKFDRAALRRALEQAKGGEMAA